MMSAMRIAALLAVLMVPVLGATGRPNVLFIAVDDLRPWLGCYDEAFKGIAPNIDRLAGEGRVFRRHYVQVPTCGASRCGLMFGRYPERLPGDAGNEAIARTAAKQPHPSLPALFRSGGYRTLSIGKITHYPGGRGGKGWKDGPEELPGAWDVCTMPTGPWQSPEAAMHGYANGVPRTGDKKSPLSEFVEGDDKIYPDGWIAEEAVARLKDESASGKPFFLAAGFIKPHLPFVAPKRYAEEAKSFPLPEPAGREKPSFPSTWHPSSEFRRYRFNEGDPFESKDAAAAYRRDYLACIRYMDGQIGKLLSALDASPAGKNTVVVLWGDHGWLHGEHGVWGKHCLFEEALHSPLIVRAPSQEHPGVASDEIVETVDVYPTLAGLAGLPLPASLDGKSLVPLLEDPAAKSDGVAISAWQDKQSIRNDRYRLMVSTKDSGYLELYDHRTDPGEVVNIAPQRPDEVGTLRAKLATHLEAR